MRKIGYWIATGLVTAVFSITGVALLARVPHFTQDMTHLGYPSYFLTVLGTWKVLGAMAVAAPGLPRLKEWAYAGMIFDLTSAAASRAIRGDPPATVIIPLIIACVVVTSWALRPRGRALIGQITDRRTAPAPSAT